MNISRQQELALCSALLPTDRAGEKWNELLSLTPVEELDASITRILPAIYQNLRGAPALESVAKLKGSHLFTWAKNTEFITNIKPLLEALADTEVDYRILKGGAINFLLHSLGTRSMGDIDILVTRRSLAQFQLLLEQTGFRNKFTDKCPHIDPENSNLELNYINDSNIEIDLHVMEDRRPARLFELIMATPPRICDFMELKINIPSVELLILHSMYHGRMGIQSSDEIQSLLDLQRLLPFADRSELLRVGNTLHFNDMLGDYLDTIEEVTGETSSIQISQVTRVWQRFKFTLSGIVTLLKRIKELPSIRRARVVNMRDVTKIARRFPGHRFTYAFWLLSGKLRPLERFLYKRQGGFLDLPKMLMVLNSDNEYSTKNTHNRIQFSPYASPSQDWRFSFTLPRDTNRVTISMTSRSFGDQSFLIFINGLLGGVTDRNQLGTHRLEVFKPAEKLEISLRLPANGCEICALKLGDLVLQVA